MNDGLLARMDKLDVRLDALEGKIDKIVVNDLPHLFDRMEKRLREGMATKADVHAEADRMIEAIQHGTNPSF